MTNRTDQEPGEHNFLARRLRYPTVLSVDATDTAWSIRP